MRAPNYTTAALALSMPNAPHPYEDPQFEGFFDDIGHAISGAAKAVSHAVSDVGKAVGGVAKGIANVAKDVGEAVGKAALAPVTFVADVGDAVVHGERIDRALMHAAEHQAKIFKDVAGFAQIGLSFIPGIGQGISAAIGAGLALAEGKPITDALLAGVKGALPGGPLAAAAFDAAARAAIGVAEGKRIDEIALSAVRNNLPGGDAAKIAFDTGLALAQGKKLQDVALQAATRVGGQLASNIKLPSGVTNIVDSAGNVVRTVENKASAIASAAQKLLPNTPLAHGAYEMTRRALAGQPLQGSAQAAILRNAARLPPPAMLPRAKKPVPKASKPKPAPVRRAPVLTVRRAPAPPTSAPHRIAPSYLTSIVPYAATPLSAPLGEVEAVDELAGFDSFMSEVGQQAGNLAKVAANSAARISAPSPVQAAGGFMSAVGQQGGRFATLAADAVAGAPVQTAGKLLSAMGKPTATVVVKMATGAANDLKRVATSKPTANTAVAITKAPTAPRAAVPVTPMSLRAVTPTAMTTSKENGSAVPYVVGGVAALAALGGGAWWWMHHRASSEPGRARRGGKGQ